MVLILQLFKLLLMLFQRAAEYTHWKAQTALFHIRYCINAHNWLVIFWLTGENTSFLLKRTRVFLPTKALFCQFLKQIGHIFASTYKINLKDQNVSELFKDTLFYLSYLQRAGYYRWHHSGMTPPDRGQGRVCSPSSPHWWQLTHHGGSYYSVVAVHCHSGLQHSCSPENHQMPGSACAHLSVAPEPPKTLKHWCHQARDEQGPGHHASAPYSCHPVRAVYSCKSDPGPQYAMHHH